MHLNFSQRMQSLLNNETWKCESFCVWETDFENENGNMSPQKNVFLKMIMESISERRWGKCFRWCMFLAGGGRGRVVVWGGVGVFCFFHVLDALFFCFVRVLFFVPPHVLGDAWEWGPSTEPRAHNVGIWTHATNLCRCCFNITAHRTSFRNRPSTHLQHCVRDILLTVLGD